MIRTSARVVIVALFLVVRSDTPLLGGTSIIGACIAVIAGRPVIPHETTLFTFQAVVDLFDAHAVEVVRLALIGAAALVFYRLRQHFLGRSSHFRRICHLRRVCHLRSVLRRRNNINAICHHHVHRVHQVDANHEVTCLTIHSMEVIDGEIHALPGIASVLTDAHQHRIGAIGSAFAQRILLAEQTIGDAFLIRGAGTSHNRCRSQNNK